MKKFMEKRSCEYTKNPSWRGGGAKGNKLNMVGKKSNIVGKKSTCRLNYKFYGIIKTNRYQLQTDRLR